MPPNFLLNEPAFLRELHRRDQSPVMSVLAASDSPSYSMSEDSDLGAFSPAPFGALSALDVTGFPRNYSRGSSSTSSFESSLQPHIRHPAYNELSTQLKLAQHRCTELQKENLVLQTQNVTLNRAYETLAKSVTISSGAIPTTLEAVSSLATINPLSATLAPVQSEYPHVRFWHKHDWVAFVKDNKGGSISNGKSLPERGRVRASQGENVSMLFVEDENGNPVDGHKATEIRRIARSIWVHLAMVGKAPKTWLKADIHTADHYKLEMRRHFPDLRLCESDWKADQIAIEHYPSWHSNHIKSTGTNTAMKQEDPSLTSSTMSKRPNRAMTHVVKRKKMDHEERGDASSNVSTADANISQVTTVLKIKNPLTIALETNDMLVQSDQPDVTAQNQDAPSFLADAQGFEERDFGGVHTNTSLDLHLTSGDTANRAKLPEAATMMCASVDQVAAETGAAASMQFPLTLGDSMSPAASLLLPSAVAPLLSPTSTAMHFTPPDVATAIRPAPPAATAILPAPPAALSISLVPSAAAPTPPAPPAAAPTPPAPPAAAPTAPAPPAAAPTPPAPV